MLSDVNLEDFLEGINDAMLIANENSKIIFANTACSKLFGYSKLKMSELHIEDLMPTEENTIAHKGLLKSFIINSEQARQMMSRLSIPCLKKNKEVFKAQISISNALIGNKKYGVATIQDFTELHDKIDDLNNISNTDPLTSLYNRRHLEAVSKPYSSFLKNTKGIGVFFLDLNKFKILNDTYGHEFGDFILTTISSRIKSLLRYDDLAFRLGGDEFLILIKLNNTKENKENKEILETIALKIYKKIMETIELNDIIINIKTSIGVGIYTENIGSLKTMIKLTDKAMYMAKSNNVPFTFIENL